ncbi:hypothetical protein, partial [Treponema sp. R6D11]
VYCDVCKKKMDNPITDKTFFYYANFSVCEECKDKLEYQVKPQVRAKEPFSMDWYQKVMVDTFTRAASRGRS